MATHLLRPPPDDPRHWVTPEDLNVHPALLGLPLARPGRRLLAMLVDLTLVGLLGSLFNAWLLAATVVLAGEQAWAGQQPGRPRQRGAAWVLAALLVVVGLQAGMPWNDRPRHGHSAAAIGGADDADDDDVAAALRAAGLASAPASGAAPAEALLAARVAVLEAELAAARQAPPDSVRSWLRRARQALDDLGLGLGLGWALAYFTLLPAWWAGQTPGKRLLGLRVVELTGKPMTAMLAFKRYGGYGAAMATGGVGLLQLLWDPNRQAIQDKTAHTVVVDLRRARRAGAPPAGQADGATALPATNPPP